MNKRNFFSKSIAWLLIATMVNPAAMAPAFARDTDIFLSTTAGSATAEPNIMIVLDTSDSMNLFEDWREYPGNYDSHVEYLWNDAIIGLGGSPQNAESSSFIATGIGPTVTSITRVGNVATVQFATNHGYTNLPTPWTVNVYNATDPLYNGQFTIASVPTASSITYTMTGTPAANAVTSTVLYASARARQPFSTLGFWGGNTPEERTALWSAAKTYALGTESIGSGDPGIRTVWRNYNDPSWVYWTTFNITSKRLRAPSFNRFRGHVQSIGGTRGGISFGATTNDFRGYNKCNDSGNAPAVDFPTNPNALGKSALIDSVDGVTPQGLTPSTIYAPSSAPRNSGRYRGQEWVRWERFLRLREGRFSNGDSNYASDMASFSTTNVGPAYPIAASSGTGNGGSNVTLRNDHAVSPLNASAKRDSYNFAPPYGNGTNNIGQLGLPIRTRIDQNTAGTVTAGTDSYAGWTMPKADFGGFIFASIIYSAQYAAAFVSNGNATYGGTTNTTYGVLAEMLDYYNVPGSTGLTGAFPQNNHVLFKAWLGNRDTTGAGNWDNMTGTPAYYDHGGSLGTKNNNSSIDMDVGSSNGASSFAAGQIINISNGATNVVATISTVTTFGGNPRITLTSAALAGFAGGASLRLSANLRLVTASSGGAACTRLCGVASNNSATDPAVDASGASRTYKVGGGSCQDNGLVGSGCPSNGGTAAVPAACGSPYAGVNYFTAVFAGCGWSGRQSLVVEGVGTYYYGGTCGAGATCRGIGNVPNGSPCPAAASPTTTFGSSSYVASNRCSVSGVSNLTLNGVQMAGAVLGSASAGCGNMGNWTTACPRPAAPGFAVPANQNAGCVWGPTCGNVSTFEGTTPTNADYAVFNLAANDPALVHDCIRDNNTNGNPSNGYAKQNTDVPFATTWTTGYNTANPSTAPYSDSGNAISGGAIDAYSVNYLNWQFGPKGPNAAPIGRKTRLQIAKDALSGIVASTNGVRFGLMVFNRTAACLAASGVIAPGTSVFTAGDPGFMVGQSVAVVGAGASGANLTTTISGAVPNVADPTQTDFTLAASATNPSTTGSMALASTTVTVASLTGFAPGQLVRVSGADPGTGGDLIARVMSLLAGPPRLVLSDSASGAVAGAAVTVASFQTTMQSSPCAGAIASEGANVARVIKRMGSNSTDTPDYNNRATLINAINAVTAAARTPLTESVYEAYRYFSGRSPKWGTSTATATTGGSVTAGRDTTAICTATGAGTGCMAVGSYASPMLNNPNTTTPAGCQKNFVVLITDGGPEDDFGANADVRSLNWSGPLGIVAARTGLDASQSDTMSNQFEAGSPTLPYGPTDLAGTAFDGGYIWLDELTYFMANADLSPGARNFPGDTGSDSITGRQSVNTYTIGFAGASSPVLQNAALRGNGVYYTADNSAALSAAIIAALAAITAWNPTVAAPTVPISALNRSENATDVYLAFFQPDPSSAWLGTVKKFQLSQYPNNGDATICGAGIGLCLIGQTSLTKAPPNPSPTYNIETVEVDIITGISQSQVDINASSFWAPSSVTDGSLPYQGGSGHQLINNTPTSTPPGTLTPETRNVYTFLTTSAALQDANSGGTIDLTNSVNKVHFSNAARISKCRLGDSAACGGTATYSGAQQETYINWLRGGDVATTTACNDGLASNCTTWRAWPHSDVQHSKPAIVTYQVPPSPIIQYMYYVQNNGLLTAMDTATGIEKWSFMVEEAMPQIQSMISDSAGAQIHVADGTPAVYTEETAGVVTKAWLYFGLRRGGRVLYAIDITVPDAPIFGWKIDASQVPAKICVANGVCTNAPEFNELGQTWSTPFIGKVRPSANANPVLIFGGGYDPADDCMPVVTGPGPTGCTPAARSMGRAVFVIDAFDAHLVQSWGTGQSGPFIAGGASMIYAIPSDVTALNTDLDSQGYIDRIYVGDTWGNVWRFDTNDAAVANWNGKLLATLSSDITTNERRKILFPPAIVKQNVPYRFDAVYVGTGDREHPICLTYNQTTPTVMTNSCPLYAPTDKMFMLVDPDYGLTMGGTAAITFSELYQRLTTDLTVNTSNTILNSYKGWYRDLDNGEKVVNAPTVFSNRLRFGTYAPLGQSGGACVPPGEGRLNEIDAITGDLVPINGAVGQPSDRYYSTFITHGYISTGQLIVQGKNIYHIVVSDSRLQSVLVGSMGSATKIYWYMEPEQ